MAGRRRDRKLTPRQKRFVVEYMEDLNATQAAIRSGYSKKTARQIGYELRHSPNIERAIARRIDRELTGKEAKKTRVVQELNAIAFFDPRDVVKWTKDSVTLVSSAQIPDSAAAAIKAVKETRDGIHIVFHDKLEALDKLAKIHNAYRNLLDEDRKTVVEGGNLYFTIEIGDRIERPGKIRISEDELKRGRDLERIARGPAKLLGDGGDGDGFDDQEDDGEW